MTAAQNTLVRHCQGGRGLAIHARPNFCHIGLCPSITTTTFPPSLQPRHHFAHLYTMPPTSRCLSGRKPGWIFSVNCWRRSQSTRRLCELSAAETEKFCQSLFHPRSSITNCLSPRRVSLQAIYSTASIFTPCRMSQHNPWTSCFLSPPLAPVAINPPDRASIQDGKHHNRKHTVSLPSHTLRWLPSLCRPR
jgi:hypothetical protein